LDSLTAEDRTLIDRKLMQARTYKDLGKESVAFKAGDLEKVDKILKSAGTWLTNNDFLFLLQAAITIASTISTILKF